MTHPPEVSPVGGTPAEVDKPYARPSLYARMKVLAIFWLIVIGCLAVWAAIIKLVIVVTS